MENDAIYVVGLLFAIVSVPPLVGIRMMYTMCWLLFTVFAHIIALDAALGLATSMGISIMVEWYALRVFDRSLFSAALNGWVGMWANSSVVGLIARFVDCLIHLLLPMVLIACYLPLVRIWMSAPALM